VQRGFRKYHTEPPTDKTMREWYRKFEEMDCLCTTKRTGKPGSSSVTVDHVRESFTRSPQKSTRRASRELQLDRAPPHFYLEVRRHLSTTLPQRWIGRPSNEDSALIPWPPRSPDLTPCGRTMLKIKFTCPLYQEICHSFDRESWLQLIPSMLICCNVCGKS
jgi:hypothetical protein